MLSRLFKKQLKTVIEWKPADDTVLLERYQGVTDEIKNASDLIVGPGQGCILVQNGIVCDVFLESGKFTISTENRPFFTTLKNIMKSFESSEKSYIFFYKTTEFVNQRWGTMMPIKYVDPVYQFPVELGANGSFSAKITDARLFFEKIVGSANHYTADDFRKLIISRATPTITELLAKSSLGYAEIDQNLRTLSTMIQQSMEECCVQLGIGLTNFGINGTQFSEQTNEQIQKIIASQSDKVAASAVGLNYVEHEKIKAMRDAARNEGGLAGAGLQLGAGMELGKGIMTDSDKIDQNALIEKIRALKTLLDEGILTQDEFDAKKAEYLAQL